MTGDSPFDVAPVAALGIIAKLEADPPMTRRAKPATVTYDVLDAIHAAIEQAGRRLDAARARRKQRGRDGAVPKPNGEHSAANGRRPPPLRRRPGERRHTFNVCGGETCRIPT